MFISNSNTAPFQMKPARKTFGKRQSYKSTLSLSYCVNIKLVVQKIKRNEFFLTYHEMHSTKTFSLTQKQKCFILNLLAARQCAHNTSGRQKPTKRLIWVERHNIPHFCEHFSRDFNLLNNIGYKEHKMLFYSLIKLSKSMCLTKTSLYISLNLQTHLVVFFEISMHLHNEFTKGIPIIICINVIFILTNCRTL